MPVIELTALETYMVDVTIKDDLLSELALDDRAARLRDIGWLEKGAEKYAIAGETNKRNLLATIASSRMLPCGSRAALPSDFSWVRDPRGPAPEEWRENKHGRPREQDRDGSLLVWGEGVWEDLGGGRVKLRPYTPLPRYLDDEELELVTLYASRRAPSAPGIEEEPGVERFRGLDLT